MDNVCRVCADASDDLLNIFEKQQSVDEPDEPSVAEMLIECVDCNVRPDDPFPKQICSNCLLGTQNAYNLKRKYEESHQYLCKLLDNKVPIRESITNEENKHNMECYGFEIIMDAVENYCGLKDQDGFFEENTEPYEGTPRQEDTDLLTPLEDNASDPIYACDKACKTRRKLLLHKRAHGIKPKCIYCQNLFENRHQLERHLRLHMEDPSPFKCTECRKSFAERSYLNRHIRFVHKGGGRNQQCPHCPMRFSGKKPLKNHMEIHFGVRPIPCEFCRGRFQTQELLDLHQLLHKGENPYKCGDCDKSFFRHSLLQRHAKCHAHLPRPFQCQNCSAGFYYGEYLNKHVQFDCRSGESIK